MQKDRSLGDVMQPSLFLPSTAGSYEDQPFRYHGCQFICSASAAGGALYQPHVLYQHGMSGIEQTVLPLDPAPYASAAEALRHAEQQAVRWVHDRTADSQGLVLF
jgi:hypothetical protein